MLKNSDVPERKEKLGGGEGKADKYSVQIPDSDGAFTMATRIELEKGSSIGYHIHSDNEEVYTIISGTGIYNEDGKEVKTSAGDVFLCRRGHSHSLKNTGEGKLVIGAAIAKRG